MLYTDIIINTELFHNIFRPAGHMISHFPTGGMKMERKKIINENRLWKHLRQLAEIGKNQDGSITRLPFTPQDRQAELLILTFMKEAGLETRRDAAGNLIGRWMPEDPAPVGGIAPIIAGSHFDTVLKGGAFDGCLGLLGAIEAVQTLRESGFSPSCPIYVIGFRDEEGNRFGYGMIGSRSICGKVKPEGLLSRDQDGICLKDAMTDFGLDPSRLDTCRIFPVRAMLELHIEQADMLEQTGNTIGIVEGIAGLERHTIRIEGNSAHAGATPMKCRKDPVPAMSRWILEITRMAQEREHCVATVGNIHTSPGACNIICDHVEFSLDLRSLRDQDRKEIMEEMEVLERQLESRDGIRITRRMDQEIPSAPCDTRLKKSMEEICRKNGYSFCHLMSGAGHDSMNFSGLCPISMIFVPSVDGRSHRKEEFTSSRDCAAGVQVLMEMILAAQNLPAASETSL